MSLNTQEPWEGTAKFQGLDLLSRKENLFLKRIKERGQGKRNAFFCVYRVVVVCVFCVAISIRYMKPLWENLSWQLQLNSFINSKIYPIL